MDDFYDSGAPELNLPVAKIAILDGNEIYINFYRPITPFELNWDVYSSENMLSVPSAEDQRTEDFEKAVHLQEAGKKAKKKDLSKIIETIPKRKIRSIKGNCTWRNVLGALTSCNVSRMEPELSEYLGAAGASAARRPRWQLPAMTSPVPNEIIATYTSQQGASDQNPAQQNTVWLDGVGSWDWWI